MTWSKMVQRIRQLHARREPLNISAVRRNRRELLQAAFEIKPFLGWLGAVRAAGLEYNQLRVGGLKSIGGSNQRKNIPWLVFLTGGQRHRVIGL